MEYQKKKKKKKEKKRKKNNLRHFKTLLQFSKLILLILGFYMYGI